MYEKENGMFEIGPVEKLKVGVPHHGVYRIYMGIWMRILFMAIHKSRLFGKINKGNRT